MPVITLLISTYNWVDALERAFEGIRKQTVLPDEIVVADDGSRDDTRQFINKTALSFPVPIIHVWHEDKGFRRTAILNKAIAKCSGDYIIEMDGDIIPERHFVQDHIEVMKDGRFVCGSRVLLHENGKPKSSHWLNLVRCGLLRAIIANVVNVVPVKHVRGCNLAFWKKDFLAVNGYNEDIEGYGYEDQEMVWRLAFYGIRGSRLKFGGVERHIYHGKASRNSLEVNNDILSETIQKKLTRAENGIDKYL